MIENESDIKFGTRLIDEKGLKLMVTTPTIQEGQRTLRVCEFNPRNGKPIGDGRPMSAKRIIELIKGSAAQSMTANDTAGKRALGKKKDPRRVLRSSKFHMATARSCR